MLQNVAKKTWIFHWKQGGYNSVLAENKWDAVALAKRMARYTILVVAEDTVRVAEPGEVEKYNQIYEGLFT